MKTDRAPDDEGHREHRHPCDFGGGVEENATDDDDCCDDLPNIVDAAVQETFELIDIVVQNGKQTTRGAIFKISQFKMLDVVVGIDSQIVLDGLGEVAPSDLVEVLEGRFEDPDKDRQPREDEELGAGILNAEFGKERIFLRDDNIYRCADQDGRGEVEDFVEDGIEGG